MASRHIVIQRLFGEVIQIKIFRSIRRNAIVEGKLKNYLFYAIGEILLIVVGILVALQINSWTLAKRNYTEETAILTRIQMDFENNQRLLNNNQKKWQVISNDLRELLEMVGPNPKEYPDKLVHKYMSSLYFIPGYNPSKGAVSSIILSGKISLIENLELRYKLNQWPTVLDEYKFSYSIIREMVYDFQNSFRGYHQFKDSQKNINPNKKTLGSSRFSYDQRRLLSLPTLETAVELKRVDTDGLELTILELIRLQDEILSLLEGELESR